MTVNVGDLAPPVEVAATDGTPWRIGEHLGRPVVLIFHRHLH
jgi:peroxiredoxin